MKKSLVIVLCLLMVLSLTVMSGCNPVDDSDASIESDVSGSDESYSYEDYYPEGTDITISDEDKDKYTPSELIAKGLVRRVGALDESPVEAALPLVKWVFENAGLKWVLAAEHNLDTFEPIGTYYFDEIHGLNLYNAAYNIKSTENLFSQKYSILFASTLDNPREYVLVYHNFDVDLTDMDVLDELKSHEVFGNLIPDNPKGINNIVLETTDLTDIIGKNQLVLEAVHYKDDEILVISTTDNKELQADIIDLSTLRVVKSQALTEPAKSGLELRYFSIVAKHPGIWCFSFCEYYGEEYQNSYCYLLEADEDGNLKEFLEKQPNGSKHLTSFPEEYQLRSTTGQYVAHHGGGSDLYIGGRDLYIKDTQTQKTTRIFKSELVFDEPGVYSTVTPEFFADDVLYYSVHEFWDAKLYSYNPITKQTVEYPFEFSNMHYSFYYIGEYIYAYHYSNNGYVELVRFDMEGLGEKQIIYNCDYSFFNPIIEDDKENFAILSRTNILNSETLILNCPVIRLYDHYTLEVIFEMGFENPELGYDSGVITDNYVFVPVYEPEVTQHYKEAYVIKYK